MDLEKIKQYNEEQQRLGEEQGKTEDMALAVTMLLNSQNQIEQRLGAALTGIVATLKKVKGDKPQDLTPLIGSIEAVIKETQDSRPDFSGLMAKLDGVTDTLNSLSIDVPTPRVTVQSQDLRPQFDQLEESIRGIKVESPSVNVEAPIVNIPPSSKKPSYLDLSTYHAQDLDAAEAGVQFIGFTNLDGYWYILRNDIKRNEMRYKFGKDNYRGAWAIAPTFRYKLLEEAIRGIKA